MRAFATVLLKGQPDSSPGQSEATSWVGDIKLNSPLFLFSAGRESAENRKRGDKADGRGSQGDGLRDLCPGLLSCCPFGAQGRTSRSSGRRDCAAVSVDRRWTSATELVVRRRREPQRSRLS